MIISEEPDPTDEDQAKDEEQKLQATESQDT